jgi:thioredoxin 1
MPSILRRGKIPAPAAVNVSATSEKGQTKLALEATETTFQETVLDSDGKVIVDFWAEWCGPCHAVSPVLDRIADEREDVKIVKVNVDHEQGLALRYGVSSIPLMVLFENGEPQAQAIGALPKSALERALGLSEEA